MHQQALARPASWCADIEVNISSHHAPQELTILQLLKRYVDPLANTFNHQSGKLKVIYLGPIRALVQEIAKSWKERFAVLGVTCRELTGDAASAADELVALDNCDIICTTPEMFGRKLLVLATKLHHIAAAHNTDSITRKHKNNGGLRFFGDVRAPWLCFNIRLVLCYPHRLRWCLWTRCTCLGRTAAAASRLAWWGASK